MKKHWWKVLLFVVLLGVGLFAGRQTSARYHYVESMGEVAVAYKFAQKDKDFLVVTRVGSGSARPVTLQCSPNQYSAVDVGDRVFCYSQQEVNTRSGFAVELETESGKFLWDPPVPPQDPMPDYE